jgi:lipopolysaccharide biosynthesis glycosyltransferase
VDRSENNIQREPFVLVFGADDNYAMSLAVTLYSVLINVRSCSLVLYIVDGGISELNKQRLLRIIDENKIISHFEWLKPDIPKLGDLKVAGHVTAATYFSLLVQDLVPERFEKAIFLDCDLIAETDIYKLWQKEIGNNALLAVRDFLIPCVSSPGGVARFKELGHEPGLPYFNAGVLVFNLQRWRVENINQKIFHYLRKYRKHLNFRDQEGLNAVLAGEWGMLDPRWNVASSILSIERWEESSVKNTLTAIKDELIHNPYIYHFIGPGKPWHLNCEHPAKVKWRRYLKESRWFDPIENVFS